MKNCEESLDVKKIVSCVGLALGFIALSCFAAKAYKECDKEKLKEFKHKAKHFVAQSPDKLKHLIAKGKRRFHHREERVLSYFDDLNQRVDNLQGDAKEEYKKKLEAIEIKIQKALGKTNAQV